MLPLRGGLVILVVAACSAGVPASPSASATGSVGATASVGPTSSATTATDFRSERYGYRVTLPGKWSTSEPPGAGGVHPDEAGVDTFKQGGHIFYVTAEATDRPLGVWTCAIVQHLEGPDHELDAESSEPVTVDGVAGRLSAFDLSIKPYRIHYLEIEVVAGGRGYALSLESTTGDDAGDRAILDQAIVGFRFEG